MEPRKVVLASRNPDKVRELKEVVSGLPFEVVSAADYPGLPEVIEDGTTTLGNATRKAIITAAYTGEIALADDTSLQVRELNGWPDIFAARFSGENATYTSNAELVLDLLRNVPDGHRQARFGTACCWVDPRPELVAYSVCRPATRRWLRNPWERAVEIQDPGSEWDFWNSLADRRTVWHAYATAMLTDLAGHGHDRDQLLQVGRELLSGCPDYVGSAEAATAGVRLPDSRIWAVKGPDTDEKPLTRVAPSGLAAEAPGRADNDRFWLEITTEGRLLGEITHQPVGGQGFGYDPIFRVAGSTRTLAEMEPEAKHAISHRGRAMQRMLRAVGTAYGLRGGCE